MPAVAAAAPLVAVAIALYPLGAPVRARLLAGAVLIVAGGVELAGERDRPHRRRAEVLLARLDGAAVGFALYYGNYSTFRGRCGIHLEDLYVRPQMRGQHVGRRLLAELARITLERGCTRLEWWVLAEDEQALAFYEHIGANAKDEWTVFRLRGTALQDLAAEEH